MVHTRVAIIVGWWWVCAHSLVFTSSSAALIMIISLYTALCFSDLPHKADMNMSHCSNMLLVAYHNTMGATFWLWSREAVLVYVVSVLL